MLEWYLVIGRLPGWNNVDSMTVQAVSRNDAIEAFWKNMNAADLPVDHRTLDHVYRCGPTRPVEV